MEIQGKAKRVRIYVNEDDRAGGRPLHLAILELLRRENAQGATVLRGVEGFGATGQLHVRTRPAARAGALAVRPGREDAQRTCATGAPGGWATPLSGSLAIRS
jgi:hypothetical protein